MIGVAIVAHHGRADAWELARTTAAWLGERNHAVWMPSKDAAEFGLDHIAGDRPLADADLVLCLGGDGTMLRAVNLLDGAAVPLLGVNLGRLGYLTEIEADHITPALERFEAGSIDGHWQLDERMMLDRHDRRGRWGRWRLVAGAQRGGRREAGFGTHGEPAGADRR